MNTGTSAKKIVAMIKESKLKAQASIQGDTVRVVSKDKDTLQTIMGKLRSGDFGVALHRVDARFLGTSVVTEGAVAAPAEGGPKTVSLNMAVQDGRIQDLLRIDAESVKIIVELDPIIWCQGRRRVTGVANFRDPVFARDVVFGVGVFNIVAEPI